MSVIQENSGGVIIYVGKARVLKNRVRQYFHSSPKPAKVQAMVENIADFSYVVTPSEVDALSLENTFIKKYKPKYNILLKDDKTYPYIKLHTKEPFPHISITRRIQKDGKYFGPFMGGISCKDIVDIAARVYGVRTCKKALGKEQRPCLNYHLGRCPAPCAGYISQEDYSSRVAGAASFLAGNYEEAEEAGYISQEDYSSRVAGAASFLAGNYEEAEELLREKMQKFAENEEFELALEYRDRIEMLSRLKLRRITAMPKDVEADIWARATNGIYGAICVLVTRRGIMQGRGRGRRELSELSHPILFLARAAARARHRRRDGRRTLSGIRARKDGQEDGDRAPQAGRQARSSGYGCPQRAGISRKVRLRHRTQERHDGQRLQAA